MTRKIQMNEILLYLGISLVITLAIELSLATALKIRGMKNMLIILLANLLTNPAANYCYDWAMYLLSHDSGWLILITVALEAAAILIEFMIYRFLLDFDSIGKFKLSLILNGASFAAGILISCAMKLF